MNSSNELKHKSARPRKSKKFDDFLLFSEDSTSDSDSTIIEEEINIEEIEGDVSEEENECGECKESYRLQLNFGFNAIIAKSGIMQLAQQCKKELRDN